MVRNEKANDVNTSKLSIYDFLTSKNDDTALC